jgi:hypothetical protein
MLPPSALVFHRCAALLHIGRLVCAHSAQLDHTCRCRSRWMAFIVGVASSSFVLKILHT